MTDPLIDDLDGPRSDRLFDQLRDWSGRWKDVADWPADALELCGSRGVYRWFMPKEFGGCGWSETDQMRGLLRLAEADLTTTFVITQYIGAMRRIAGSEHRAVIDQWLERLVCGDAFATVGISHLTTSRRHLRRPVLSAVRVENGFRLDGFSPWVTGAPHAEVYVVGATLDDRREILVAVPAACPGVKAGPGGELLALSASCTDRVDFDGVEVGDEMLIAGPIEEVMKSGVGAGTGGLQTSVLAVGLARAAASFMADEASRRDELRQPTDELVREIDRTEALLLRASGGEVVCDASDIRSSANRLALRTTQAALTAAKGAGFVEGHPVGRWCRQALFFLVWSCPQPVAQAHLCEMAGIE